MNRRPQPASPGQVPGPGPVESLAAVPSLGALALANVRSPALPPVPLPGSNGRKNGTHKTGRREPALVRDACFVVRGDNECHVIAESYFYKTEPYYTILSLEYQGKTVRPSSRDVLEAYVIPVCLERVRAKGIPVCEWGISQAYVPLPALVYGLNYYATNAEYAVIRDNTAARDQIRHITNNGKYPFCFQKIPDGGEIIGAAAIFGETVDPRPAVRSCAQALYELFGLPLVRMVFITIDDACLLSSLSPAPYSLLSGQERAILTARICSRESL